MSITRTPQPVAVLISGRGSNMRALIQRAHAPNTPYRVAMVLSDKPTAAGLELARDFGIETRAVPPEKGMNRVAYDRELAAAIDDKFD